MYSTVLLLPKYSTVTANTIPGFTRNSAPLWARGQDAFLVSKGREFKPTSRTQWNYVKATQSFTVQQYGTYRNPYSCFHVYPHVLLNIKWPLWLHKTGMILHFTVTVVTRPWGLVSFEQGFLSNLVQRTTLNFPERAGSLPAPELFWKGTQFQIKT